MLLTESTFASAAGSVTLIGFGVKLIFLSLNAGATGLRDTNHHELSNVILCLPTAATADY
jgi:hypothetical protein